MSTAEQAAPPGVGAVDRLVAFYESLAPATLDRLAEVYTPDVRFKDPFHEVEGITALRAIYEQMFASLEHPRFVVTDRVVQADQCFLVWEFRFRFRQWRRQEEQVVRGGSHLTFAPDGRAREHRDYWDAAEEVYAKLPVLGALMRWLQRRARGD